MPLVIIGQIKEVAGRIDIGELLLRYSTRRWGAVCSLNRISRLG